MTTTNYPTRGPRKGRRPCTFGDSWYEQRDGRCLCEIDISWEATWMSGAPDRDDLPVGHALCANFADVVWVSPGGALTWTCEGHVPHPEDEQLKPYQDDGIFGRWEMTVYMDVHPLTGRQPVALEGCSADVLKRATAVAAKLAEYDLLPKEVDLSYGWMGSREDEERLRAAGEKTCFPYMPESLREAFGGAATMFDVARKIREAADG